MAHQDHDHEHDHDHVDEPTGLEQSIEELEFLRSACAAAAAGEEAKLARMLANKRLNVTESDGTRAGGTGYTPLHYAARSGQLGCVRLLLDNGSRVNAVTASGSATALHRAAHQGHLAVVQALVQARADVGALDSDGQTALHKAAENGHGAVCAELLRLAPATADLHDKRGRSPRDLASERGGIAF